MAEKKKNNHHPTTHLGDSYSYSNNEKRVEKTIRLQQWNIPICTKKWEYLVIICLRVVSSPPIFSCFVLPFHNHIHIQHALPLPSLYLQSANVLILICSPVFQNRFSKLFGDGMNCMKPVMHCNVTMLDIQNEIML